MLTDYINDLRKSNVSPDLSVQTKIQDYETLRDELRDELEEGKQRDPDNSDNGRLLTPQERSKLILMLYDYQAVLQRLEIDEAETLQEGLPDDGFTGSSRHLEIDMELISIKGEDESGDSGDVPLYLSEADFSGGVYMESLTAALDLCDNQVQEFVKVLLPSVVIFHHLCKHLAGTLSSTSETKFERYRSVLLLLQNLDLEGSQISSNLRNSVSFCFESLVGLARRFQLVADLLQKCGSAEWYKSALELADVRPRKHFLRWSEFSLAIRNCEWSLDLVELAFHALAKLLTDGTYTVKDASFKWVLEKGRMVLQIPGGKLERETSNPQENRLLELCRDLEERDLAALIQKLDELVQSEKDKKRFYNLGLSNAHGIALFLREKLRGPTPETGSYLPYSYSFSKIDSSSLKYLEYLDKGSSGMVAIHDWYGMKVAVKSVRGLGLSRTRFEQEAAVLAMAQHPNVVRLIGYGFLEKPPYGTGTGQLVMELMDHDLRTVIDSRLSVLPKGSSPFSPIVAIDLMLQIAQAMWYLWEQKILHRDLKAKNVLVNICKPLKASLESDTANTKLMGLPAVSAVLPHTQENYVAKLADFGLAKCRPQSSYMTTVMAGTTGWRAPEIFHVPDSEAATAYKWPADVYSFAMTGYEIVTGKAPFEDEPNYSLHAKIMAGERPSFENLRSDFPDAVKELIQECWATNPKDRPNFDYIVKKLWECKVLSILPGFERKIMDTGSVGASGRS